MQPMSDPKTSPNNRGADLSVSFQDRIYVIGNASFVCLVVCIVWTVLFIGRAQLNLQTLVLLAAPLVATGTTVLVGAMFKDLVPKPVTSLPLNITVPLIWCVCCYLAVMMISTQETSSTRVPEPLMPALVWANLSNLLAVLIGQVVVLSLVVLFSREKA